MAEQKSGNWSKRTELFFEWQCEVIGYNYVGVFHWRCGLSCVQNRVGSFDLFCILLLNHWCMIHNIWHVVLFVYIVRSALPFAGVLAEGPPGKHRQVVLNPLAVCTLRGQKTFAKGLRFDMVWWCDGNAGLNLKRCVWNSSTSIWPHGSSPGSSYSARLGNLLNCPVKLQLLNLTLSVGSADSDGYKKSIHQRTIAAVSHPLLPGFVWGVFFIVQFCKFDTPSFVGMFFWGCQESKSKFGSDEKKTIW